MSRHDERPLLEAVRDAGRMGRLCALATIVDTRGSTPRKIGTKMLVDPVAGLVGTVGGGCGEAEVIEAANEVLRTGLPRMVHVDLTRDLMSWSPAVCGGIMRVLVEPVEPAIAGRPKEPAGEGAVADVDRPKEARASGDGPAPTS
jgi:xanthine dehydrogenase accessory factor